MMWLLRLHEALVDLNRALFYSERDERILKLLADSVNNQRDDQFKVKRMMDMFGRRWHEVQEWAREELR